MLLELDIVMRENTCPHIVQFYGALFEQVIIVSRFFPYSPFVDFVGRLLDLYGTNEYISWLSLQIRLP